MTRWGEGFLCLSPLPSEASRESRPCVTGADTSVRMAGEVPPPGYWGWAPTAALRFPHSGLPGGHCSQCSAQCSGSMWAWLGTGQHPPSRGRGVSSRRGRCQPACEQMCMCPHAQMRKDCSTRARQHPFQVFSLLSSVHLYYKEVLRDEIWELGAESKRERTGCAPTDVD